MSHRANPRHARPHRQAQEVHWGAESPAGVATGRSNSFIRSEPPTPRHSPPSFSTADVVPPPALVPLPSPPPAPLGPGRPRLGSVPPPPLGVRTTEDGAEAVVCVRLQQAALARLAGQRETWKTRLLRVRAPADGGAGAVVELHRVRTPDDVAADMTLGVLQRVPLRALHQLRRGTISERNALPFFTKEALATAASFAAQSRGAYTPGERRPKPQKNPRHTEFCFGQLLLALEFVDCAAVAAGESRAPRAETVPKHELGAGVSIRQRAQTLTGQAIKFLSSPERQPSPPPGAPPPPPLEDSSDVKLDIAFHDAAERDAWHDWLSEFLVKRELLQLQRGDGSDDEGPVVEAPAPLQGIPPRPAQGLHEFLTRFLSVSPAELEAKRAKQPQRSETQSGLALSRPPCKGRLQQVLGAGGTMKLNVSAKRHGEVVLGRTLFERFALDLRTAVIQVESPWTPSFTMVARRSRPVAPSEPRSPGSQANLGQGGSPTSPTGGAMPRGRSRSAMTAATVGDGAGDGEEPDPSNPLLQRRSLSNASFRSGCEPGVGTAGGLRLEFRTASAEERDAWVEWLLFVKGSDTPRSPDRTPPPPQTPAETYPYRAMEHLDGATDPSSPLSSDKALSDVASAAEEPIGHGVSRPRTATAAAAATCKATVYCSAPLAERPTAVVCPGAPGVTAPARCTVKVTAPVGSAAFSGGDEGRLTLDDGQRIVASLPLQCIVAAGCVGHAYGTAGLWLQVVMGKAGDPVVEMHVVPDTLGDRRFLLDFLQARCSLTVLAGPPPLREGTELSRRAAHNPPRPLRQCSAAALHDRLAAVMRPLPHPGLPEASPLRAGDPVQDPVRAYVEAEMAAERRPAVECPLCRCPDKGAVLHCTATGLLHPEAVRGAAPAWPDADALTSAAPTVDAANVDVAAFLGSVDATLARAAASEHDVALRLSYDL